MVYPYQQILYTVYYTIKIKHVVQKRKKTQRKQEKAGRSRGGANIRQTDEEEEHKWKPDQEKEHKIVLELSGGCSWQ